MHWRGQLMKKRQPTHRAPGRRNPGFSLDHRPYFLYSICGQHRVISEAKILQSDVSPTTPRAKNQPESELETRVGLLATVEKRLSDTSLAHLSCGMKVWNWRQGVRVPKRVARV